MAQESNGWADGLTTSASVYRRVSTTEWTQDDTSLTTIRNPRVSARQTILLSGYVATKTIRTEFTYAAASDHSGNTKEIREYDFAGALRRKTTLAYLHESNGTYVGLNMLDRVTEALVRDAVNNLVSRTQVAYDLYSPYSATGAIRHDAAYGTGYLTRGLPSTVTRWYDLAQNLYVTTTTKYDECGNVREVVDPMSHMSFIEYWLSAADYAYAFPLRATNPLGHASLATYSYKSGVPLTKTDANGQVTSMLYDARDRVTRVTRAIWWGDNL